MNAQDLRSLSDAALAAELRHVAGFTAYQDPTHRARLMVEAARRLDGLEGSWPPRPAVQPKPTPYPRRRQPVLGPLTTVDYDYVVARLYAPAVPLLEAVERLKRCDHDEQAQQLMDSLATLMNECRKVRKLLADHRTAAGLRA